MSPCTIEGQGDLAVRELLVPVTFQRAGAQPVLRGKRQKAAPGEVGRVLGTFASHLPWPLDLAGLSFHLLQGRQGDGHLGGRHGFEEAPGDGRVHPIPTERLAGGPGLGDMEGHTRLTGPRAISQVAHTHAPPTPPAEYEPLQQGCPRTDGPPPGFRTAGAVIIELLVVAEKVLPGEGAWMGVVQDERPLLLCNQPRAAFDPWRCAGEDLRPGAGAALDIGPSIGGSVEDGQHPRMGEGAPHQLDTLAGAPPARWEAERVSVAMGNDG